MNRRFSTFLWRCTAWASCLAAVGCYSYEPAPVELEEVLGELAAAPELPTPLRFEDALIYAFENAPILEQLEAEAEAAGEDLPTRNALWRLSTRERMTSVVFDPAEWLGILQRGADVDLAEAKEAAKLAEWIEARWKLAAEIAEAFAVEAVLREIEAPVVDVDEQAFFEAGLASEVAAIELRAARVAAEVEARAIERERERNFATLKRALGVAASTAVELEIDPAVWHGLSVSRGGEELSDRPDLAVTLASYTVSERELARAVTEQYPRLLVGPMWMMESTLWGALINTWLPLDAGPKIRAASARRTAARAALAVAWLAAEESWTLADEEFAEHVDHREVSALATEAALAKLRVARAKLEVEADAFEPYVHATSKAVQASIELRRAHVQHAESKVRQAFEGGWPPELFPPPDEDEEEERP